MSQFNKTPFNYEAMLKRFLARIDWIKQTQDLTDTEISAKLSPSNRLISNIKLGRASITIEILHNLEQEFGIDKYEIIDGVSIQKEKEKAISTTKDLIAQLQAALTILEK